MEEPYTLTGPVLRSMKDKFHLIKELVDDDESDSFVFDLAWFNDTDYAEANKLLFVDLAEGRPVGVLYGKQLHLSGTPYTSEQIEEFLTFMLYGDRGMGIRHAPGVRVSNEEVVRSYLKDRAAMFKKFKKNFAANNPGALGHGNGRPRADPLPAKKIKPTGSYYWRGTLHNSFNNDDEDEPTQREKRERHALGLHVNYNGNATHGKLAGKKSSKTMRKGLMRHERTRKFKKWTRPNNNNNNE